MVVLAPLAAAKAAMMLGKTVSNALGTKPTPTPKVDLGTQQAPSKDKYKDTTKPVNEMVGDIGSPQQRTEQSVETDSNGQTRMGMRKPIKGSGMSMTQDQYRRGESTTYE